MHTNGTAGPKLLMVTTVPVTLRAFLLPFAEHFRRRGFRVDAMAEGIEAIPECTQAFDKVWEVQWSRNPIDPRNLFSAPARVREVVKQGGYDLVHVHTPVAAFVTRMALRNLRKQGGPRVIYTAHGFHFYEGGPRLRCAVFRTLERLAGTWTDYLVVINREDEQAAVRYRVMPKERVRYMPGIGVDTQVYKPELADQGVPAVRSELGLAPQDKLLLMIAEFIPRKRHRDALHAFAKLGRPTAHLGLAGAGPDLEEIKTLARTLGVQESVHFLGFRKDIPSLVRASAAVLLPSAQEGLPRSVMESLSLGVPAIGSRIRGMTELLEGGCGHLVQVGDVDGLTTAMARILDHPEEAAEMGRRGRERMADLDVRRIIHMHEELYDEALKK